MTLPPLLMIAEGRKPRPRKAPVDRPKEIRLHLDIATTLRRRAQTDWIWTHFPAGERRDLRAAAKLKAIGLQPGWPDFILICPRGRAHFLEVKRVGEALSDNQEALKFWAARHGVPFVVVHSTADAMAAFTKWGCLREMMEGAQ